MTLSGPGAREGEQVFGVAHIFASFNDTFVVCMSKVLLNLHPEILFLFLDGLVRFFEV